MNNGEDLTRGKITPTLLRFTLPMMAGAMMQQCYNIADTLIVGRFIGAEALAAVGSAYTLMVFITSVMLGLSMGSGTVFSLKFGEGNMAGLRQSVAASLLLTGGITVVLNAAAYIWIDGTLRLLSVPADVYPLMRSYLMIIYGGIALSFVYNFCASLLRSVGNSRTPLWVLAASVVLNVVLDLVLVLLFGLGIEGAAWATLISQAAAAIGITAYILKTRPELIPRRKDMAVSRATLGEIATFSSLTDELRHTDGAGPRKQFRHGRDGGICGCRKDRLVCVYACTGAGQRLLDLRGAELRCIQTGTHTPRSEAGSTDDDSVLAGGVSGSLCACQTTDDDIRGRFAA